MRKLTTLKTRADSQVVAAGKALTGAEQAKARAVDVAEKAAAKATDLAPQLDTAKADAFAAENDAAKAKADALGWAENPANVLCVDLPGGSAVCPLKDAKILRNSRVRTIATS